MLFTILLAIVAVLLVLLVALVCVSLSMSRPREEKYRKGVYFPPREPGLLGLLYYQHLRLAINEKRRSMEWTLEQARIAWSHPGSGLTVMESFIGIFMRRSMLLDPRDVHFVLVQKPSLVQKPQNPYSSMEWLLGRRGLVTIRDERLHAEVAKEMRPALTGRSLNYVIENYLPKHAAQLSDALKRQFIDDPVVSQKGSAAIDEPVSRWTQGVTTEALFSCVEYKGGTNLGQEFDDMNHKMMKIMYLMFVPAWFRALLLRMVPSLGRTFSEVTKQANLIRSGSLEMAEEAAKRGQTEEVKSFVDIMAQSPMMMEDKELLSDNCMTIFAASQETTATSALHLITHMALNPRCQEILYDELKEAVALGVAPQHDDVKDLPYLQACIKESMRLTPAVGGVGREALEDIVLPSGVHIDKGTVLGISPMVMGRHPLWGDDVETFNPERWLDSERMGKIPAGLYIPFLLGPRSCIGEKQAMAELAVGLGAVMRRFKIELAPGQAAEMPMTKASVTVRPHPMLKLVLKERKD